MAACRIDSFYCSTAQGAKVSKYTYAEIINKNTIQMQMDIKQAIIISYK
jgi:hypothetical protein